MSEASPYLHEDFGQDERSLVKLPFTLLGRSGERKGKPEIKTTWEGKNEKGSVVTFFKEVTGDSKHGLPGYPAEELMIALLYLSARSGFHNRTIRVVPRQLLSLMRWGDGGDDYRRLKKSLKQLRGVSIYTNYLWSDRAKSYKEGQFGIIDNWEILKGDDSPLFDHDGGEVLEIKWNERLFEHFQEGRLKMLNVEVFYSLETPLAKRLYRWVDDALGPNGRTEIDVLLLAHTRLEISRSKKYVSQVMQALEPALDELQVRGICNWSIENSGTPSKKKLVFTRSRRQMKSREEAPTVDDATPAPDEFMLDMELACLPEAERGAMNERAVAMLDGFTRSLYDQHGEGSIAVRSVLRENLKILLEERAAEHRVEER